MGLSFRISNVTFMTVLALGIATTSCGGGYSSPSGSQANSLTGLSVYAQTSPSIPVSGSVKLSAFGSYSGPAGTSSSSEVTSTATWTSADEAVATVSKGQVTGTGVGAVAITAKLGSQSGATTVVVGLTPNIGIMPDGNGPFSLSQPQRQFFASGTYSDNTVLDLTNYVAWSASPTGIVKFDDPYGLEPGLATFTSTGTATITATLQAEEEGSLTVTVDP